MSGEFSVTFWGVRGSIACPGVDYERYGGNTSCLEVRCGPHVLVFDGGTGLNQNFLECYGRSGQPCLRCGTPLRRMVIDQRGTTWCPQCQKRR